MSLIFCDTQTAREKQQQNAGDNWFTAKLDCQKVSTFEQFIDQMALSLSFPEYEASVMQRHNPDAFADFLGDLSWLDGHDGVSLQLSSSNSLFNVDKHGGYQIWFSLLGAVYHWSVEAAYTVAGDRSKPFDVMLVDDRSWQSRHENSLSAVDHGRLDSMQLEAEASGQYFGTIPAEHIGIPAETKKALESFLPIVIASESPQASSSQISLDESRVDDLAQYKGVTLFFSGFPWHLPYSHDQAESILLLCEVLAEWGGLSAVIGEHGQPFNLKLFLF